MQYRLPAEWEPHQATLLVWPQFQNPIAYWCRHEQELKLFVDNYSALLQKSSGVYLLNHQTGNSPQRVYAPEVCMQRKLDILTNDIWIRDTCFTLLVPEHAGDNSNSFVYSDCLALCPPWSAYGGKYTPFDHDSETSVRVADLLKIPIRNIPFHLEGGAIETDGLGTLIASSGSLHGNGRNTHMSKTALEQALKKELFIKKVIWIDAALEGDDTDGHVDQLVRFVSPGRIAIATSTSNNDKNYHQLHNLFIRLKGCKDAMGRTLELIPVPIPANYEIDGAQVPASYLNFYINNAYVYIPQFGCDEDSVALSIMAHCFPDHKLVPVDCSLIIRGRGALHCMTRQLP